ncbi:hypothetical protein FOL46_005394 [Perkinsus olseni]|nr:hypothetical protein FOL46_005394 [Perkinsus olseni]
MVARTALCSNLLTWSTDSVIILAHIMHAVGAILASATIMVSGLDLSGIRLDGPGTPSPAGGEVDLSGISLEDPATASPVAPGLDWSGISLEDPSPTTVATELDWSSVSLESPASWADEKPSEQD